MTTNSRVRGGTGWKKEAVAATLAAAAITAAPVLPAAAAPAPAPDSQNVKVTGSNRTIERRVLPDDAPLPGNRTTMPKLLVFTTHMQDSSKFVGAIQDVLKAKHKRSVQIVGSRGSDGVRGVVNADIREFHTKIPREVGDHRPDTVLLVITPEAISNEPAADVRDIHEAMQQIIRIRPNSTVAVVLPASGDRISETKIAKFLAAWNRTPVSQDRRLWVLRASADLKSLTLAEHAVRLGREIADEVNLAVYDAASLSVYDDTLTHGSGKPEPTATDIPGFQPAAGTKSLTVSM